MKKIISLVLFLVAPFAFSESASETLQAKLNAIRTMSASFHQVVMAKKKQVSKSSGTMALSRPGRFRWQTKSPMPQLVIADGKRLWVYDIDLEQVSVKKQEKSLGGTAALFLSGYDETVSRDFDVKESSKEGKDYFDLHAKSSKANFERVKLIFQGEILTGLELYDQLGQHTDVRLSNIKTNPILAESTFRFKTPKGVDVVEQ
jgi:outer membrane lipoprotein carrier protein